MNNGNGTKDSASVHDINEGKGKPEDTAKPSSAKEKVEQVKSVFAEAFDRTTCIEIIRFTAFTVAVMGSMVLTARIVGGKASTTNAQ